MERVSFCVPKMYGDHHVLAVRKALLETDGVEDIVASSALKKVTVDYDSTKVSMDKLKAQLGDAGYSVDAALVVPAPKANIDDESAWFTANVRMTKTNPADLSMSGDFRKY